MKREVWTLALLFALPMTLAEGVPAQAAPAQTKINKCPYVITTSGSYLVQKNLSCILTAITISASNVDLDLGGHTISGSGRGDGVSVQGQSNVSIHDGTVQGFVNGVEFQGAVNGKITNVTARQNTDTGIADGGNLGLTVTGCAATQNRRYGIRFGPDARANTVTGNTANGNGDSGIILEGAFANTVTGNTANDNTVLGIALFGANGNTVERNTTDRNEDNGIHLESTHGNTVISNSVNDNACSGIALFRSYGNTVAGNTTDRNGCNGITVHENDTGNTVTGNSASANPGAGISVSIESAQNTVQNNTVSGNGVGILEYSGATGNSIQGNTATANDVGILLQASDTGNSIQSNTALSNRNWDLEDDNPGCDSNVWFANIFHTANQPCAAGLPPPPPP